MAKHQQSEPLEVAERLRQLISRWVQVTRQQAGTPTSPQVETLKLLDRDGGTSVARLAEKRSVKHQSMRLLVAQLEADGLVLRQPDPHDQRSQIVLLSTAGRRHLRSQEKQRAAWMSSLFQASNAPTITEVAAAVTTLENLLQAAAKSTKQS